MIRYRMEACSWYQFHFFMPISGQAIPDTKLTIKKYADVKFEYLSYCLKVSIVNIKIAIVIIVVTIAFAIEDFL